MDGRQNTVFDRVPSGSPGSGALILLGQLAALVNRYGYTPGYVYPYAGSTGIAGPPGGGITYYPTGGGSDFFPWFMPGVSTNSDGTPRVFLKRVTSQAFTPPFLNYAGVPFGIVSTVVVSPYSGGYAVTNTGGGNIAVGTIGAPTWAVTLNTDAEVIITLTYTMTSGGTTYAVLETFDFSNPRSLQDCANDAYALYTEHGPVVQGTPVNWSYDDSSGSIVETNPTGVPYVNGFPTGIYQYGAGQAPTGLSSPYPVQLPYLVDGVIFVGTIYTVTNTKWSTGTRNTNLLTSTGAWVYSHQPPAYKEIHIMQPTSAATVQKSVSAGWL